MRRALARLQSAADGVEVVGTHDLFHDEDLAYAERLRAAGVHCDVEVVSGAFHGFDLIVPSARVSKAFFASQCAAMAAAVG